MYGKQPNAGAPRRPYIIASKRRSVCLCLWSRRVHQRSRPTLGTLSPKTEAATQ